MEILAVVRQSSLFLPKFQNDLYVHNYFITYLLQEGFTHAVFFHSICVLGKSLLLKTIGNCVSKLGLNCCISAPTGKIASAYAAEFPDCRVNTVHSNYFIPVGKTNQNNGINWSLTDIHVLLVDEIRCTYSTNITFELIMHLVLYRKHDFNSVYCL